MLIDNTPINKDIEDLVQISLYYGEDPDMIQAGGGNTSLKADEQMWVKASGITLKDVGGKEDFVAIDLDKVKSILTDKTLLNLSDSERDIKINKQLLSSKIEDVFHRPSIETFLHALMKGKFVVHTHPVYVNAIVCSVDGRETVSRLFNESEYIWIPYRKPGYPLGYALYTAILEHYNKFNIVPSIVFLQNHGLIISGNSVKDIKRLTEKVIYSIYEYFGNYKREDTGFNKSSIHENLMLTFQKVISKFLQTTPFRLMWSQCSYVNILSFNANFMNIALKGALYPDHIVYCGEHPLILGKDDNEVAIKNKALKFIETLGYEPRYVITPEVGVLIVGANAKELNVREEMLRTYIKTLMLILKRSQPVFIADDECKYLAHWEAERYRQNLISMNNIEEL